MTNDTRSEPDSNFENPSHEFLELLLAIQELEVHLMEIMDLTSPWRDQHGIQIDNEEALIRFEILKLIRLISDRNTQDDDALASFVLFMLQADLDEDYETLRKSLEEATFLGASTVLDEHQSTYQLEVDYLELLSPTDFMRFYCAIPDQVLIHYELGDKVTEIYLGAVAKFGFEASKSSVLVESRRSSLIRLASFCSAQLQFIKELRETSDESVNDLAERFEFSSDGVDLNEDLRSAFRFVVHLDAKYLDVIKNAFATLAEIQQQVTDEEHEVNDSLILQQSTNQQQGIKSRLQALQNLLDDGIIDRYEYEQQRARIIGEI